MALSFVNIDNTDVLKGHWNVLEAPMVVNMYIRLAEQGSIDT